MPVCPYLWILYYTDNECFPDSTLPILQSFVSSNKSDVFKCHSVGDDTYMTPPYACSYSHSKFSSVYISLANEKPQILNVAVNHNWLSRQSKARSISWTPQNGMIGTLVRVNIRLAFSQNR